MTIFWLIEEKQLIAENRAVCFGLLFRFGACGVCRLRLEKSQNVTKSHRTSQKVNKRRIVLVATNSARKF
jgi:hypothetical protein